MRHIHNNHGTAEHRLLFFEGLEGGQRMEEPDHTMREVNDRMDRLYAKYQTYKNEGPQSEQLTSLHKDLARQYNAIVDMHRQAEGNGQDARITRQAMWKFLDRYEQQIDRLKPQDHTMRQVNNRMDRLYAKYQSHKEHSTQPEQWTALHRDLARQYNDIVDRYQKAEARGDNQAARTVRQAMWTFLDRYEQAIDRLSILERKEESGENDLTQLRMDQIKIRSVVEKLDKVVGSIPESDELHEELKKQREKLQDIDERIRRLENGPTAP